MSYDPYERIYKATFGAGARVKLVKQRKYPGEKLIGLIGTVRTDSGTNVSVVFDNVRNPRSSYGAYYFKPIELVEVDENGNEIMEEKTMSEKVAITNYLNTAVVTYESSPLGGRFHYANFDPELSEGDLCVVSSEAGSLHLALVTEIIDDNSKETYREVVAKVNTEAWDVRVKRRQKLSELMSKMQERAKELQDVMLYQMLAKDDSDMAALLKEYQTLSEQ